MKNFLNKIQIIKFIPLLLVVLLGGITIVNAQSARKVIKGNSISYPISDVPEFKDQLLLEKEWQELLSEDFDPKQYYLVSYPTSYPIEYLTPKFLDNKNTHNSLTKFLNKKTKTTIELSPVLKNLDKGIIKQLMNSLSPEDLKVLENRNYRITNVLDKTTYFIIEIAEIIKVSNQDDHQNLPILNYELYYLGIKDPLNGQISFARNKTADFINKFNSIKDSISDSSFKDKIISIN